LQYEINSYVELTLSNKKIFIKMRTAPVFDETGRVFNGVGIFEDISEQKYYKDALEKRIISLTRPLAKDHKIDFSDLFNLQDIQDIQDHFAEMAGVASIITYPDGTPITKPSRFCRLCKDIIRTTEKGLKNCCYSDSVIGKYNPQGPVMQLCLSGGLWDAGASISIDGNHIANWLIGQVKNEAQDEKKMIDYALEIGADSKAFQEAFCEVPVMSKEKFECIAKSLFIFASHLSKIAFQNVQQARFISKIEESKEKIFHKIPCTKTLCSYKAINCPNDCGVNLLASKVFVGRFPSKTRKGTNV